MTFRGSMDGKLNTLVFDIAAFSLFKLDQYTAIYKMHGYILYLHFLAALGFFGARYKNSSRHMVCYVDEKKLLP
jgi:hypothetical protein